MAIVRSFFCQKCNIQKEEAMPSGLMLPTLCSECKIKDRDERRAILLKGLEALTIGERLQRLESLIHNIDLKIDNISTANIRLY